MAFTVVPLHILQVAKGTQIPFGKGFVLQDTPQWLLQDTPTLANISLFDRERVQKSQHALVAEYEAAELGTPDPEWVGPKDTKPKSIQELRFEAATMANLAIWLRQPGRVRFTVGFHAMPISDRKGGTVPMIVGTESHNPMYWHPNDKENEITISHLKKAGELHQVLSTVPRRTTVWQALRSLWTGLTMGHADHRYPFFWMALEALLGPKDAGETTFKLCQRIAFFLADGNGSTAEDIFKKAKACYAIRSKIVHGRWLSDPKIGPVMADTEAIARTVVRRVIESPEMLKLFLSKERDEYLETQPFRLSKELT